MDEGGKASKRARLDELSAQQVAATMAESPEAPGSAAAAPAVGPNGTAAGAGAGEATVAGADPPAAGGQPAPDPPPPGPGGAEASGDAAIAGVQPPDTELAPTTAADHPAAMGGAGTFVAVAAKGSGLAPLSAVVAGTNGGEVDVVALRGPAPGIAQGKYTSREETWQQLEAEGELRFVYVQNDGRPEHSIWLVGLKNVFSRQLPNMPKEYIARLVFDRRHRSVAIVRKNNQVTGGITYRPFHSQRFAEIAFCAVAGAEQVRGFGTRLMNYTKKYAREMDNCEYFLTYADNSAVGYFSKQCFTKEISMPKERWHGFIKDYDGGTLMECFIHPHLPFTEFPAMIQAQKKALDARIRQYTSSHIVYPGISYWKEGGQDLGTKPPIPIDDIPGVATAGWSAETAALLRPKFRIVLHGGAVDPTPDNLQIFMLDALNRIKKDEDSWPFREPVTEELAPDYFDVIKAPMDLKTMEQRLQGRKFYITLDTFVADMNRIFNNSKIYNSSDTIYYKLAARLQSQFQQFINACVIYDEPTPTDRPTTDLTWGQERSRA